MVVIVVVCCPGSPEVARVASAGMESSGLKSSGLMKATPAPTSPPAQSQSPVRTPPLLLPVGLFVIRESLPLREVLFVFVLRWLWISMSQSFPHRTPVLQDVKCCF